MAKKKTASKKKTSGKKKVSAKKVPVKKPAAKKGAATKKAPAKKASISKKTTPKKTTSKKAPQKKAPPKKAVAKKPASKKKAPAKKAASTKKKTTKKASTKKTSDAPKPSAGPRYRVTSTGNFKDGKAAAAKLAAAAGLNIQHKTSSNDLLEKNYEKLTKSPYPRRELNKFRQILFEKRAQLVGDVSSMESKALTSGDSGSLSNVPQHMADQGSDTYDQTLALDLAASQRDLLKEIDAAIDRIDANTFGICEMLGKPINPERLEHTPWARFCIEAARQVERSGFAR